MSSTACGHPLDQFKGHDLPCATCWDRGEEMTLGELSQVDLFGDGAIKPPAPPPVLMRRWRWSATPVQWDGLYRWSLKIGVAPGAPDVVHLDFTPGAG